MKRLHRFLEFRSYANLIVLGKPPRIDFKSGDLGPGEEEDTANVSLSPGVLRTLMTQREMEILTRLFPKTAQMLARVVRTRQQFLEPDTRPHNLQHKEGKAMKWVTRERPKVDRVACPWLIKRFVDPQAEFLYVPHEEVMEVARREGAIPFDVPNVELGHRGPECSFDALIKKYNLTDRALARMAVIVRGADTAAKELALESAGLEAIAEGFRLVYHNDHELLEREMSVYDALYAYCQNIEERKTIP
ncbi:MAG TPA: chromate resistance protein ChrB domain-containing protein [Candidatus Acidoferrales bacterium]|nr:chromate resistance protein ChrB domain-containing protein [Candidatus Acidoferrales bacterium]